MQNHLVAKYCPEMISWINKREYISPEIINDIISLMGNCVLRSILTDVRESLWYSVIVDEATDVSHNEQMSVSLRWTDQNYETQESTVGLVQLPNTKAQTIFQKLKTLQFLHVHFQSINVEVKLMTVHRTWVASTMECKLYLRRKLNLHFHGSLHNRNY